MSTTLPYTALLTAAEVIRDAVKSTTLDATEHKDAIEQAIDDITSDVEEYLDRFVIVRPHVQFICSWEWERLQGDAQGRYVVYVRQWFVVEVMLLLLVFVYLGDRGMLIMLLFLDG